MSRLTGRTRHRSVSKWGRELLVLQVEEAGWESQYQFQTGYYVDVEFKKWRDAATTDISIAEQEATP